jgi:hypothetical protein
MNSPGPLRSNVRLAGDPMYVTLDIAVAIAAVRCAVSPLRW